MPGTCGSFAGMLLAPFVFLPLPYWGRVLALALLFVAGAAAGTRAERILGRKDPGEVVIDEVFGQWLTYLPFAALEWPGLAAGFVLFRLFDMTKPPPVRASENWLPGGWGVMLDDGMAALYAMPCLWALLRWVL